MTLLSFVKVPFFFLIVPTLGQIRKCDIVQGPPALVGREAGDKDKREQQLGPWAFM